MHFAHIQMKHKLRASFLAKNCFVTLQSTQNKGQQLAVVSRSWTNLYSLNSSFSLTSSGSKSASIFLEGDWQPSLTPGSGGWTTSLPISMLACKLLPISLPEGSRSEVANFTASGPFYPLWTPRVPLQFSSKMAKLSVCGKLVLLRSAGSGEATTLPTVKMQPLCQCSLSACKMPSNPTSSGGSKKQGWPVGSWDLWSQQQFYLWFQHGRDFSHQLN